jgi:hypothetical protein
MKSLPHIGAIFRTEKAVVLAIGAVWFDGDGGY